MLQDMLSSCHHSDHVYTSHPVAQRSEERTVRKGQSHANFELTIVPLGMGMPRRKLGKVYSEIKVEVHILLVPSLWVVALSFNEWWTTKLRGRHVHNGVMLLLPMS